MKLIVRGDDLGISEAVNMELEKQSKMVVLLVLA